MTKEQAISDFKTLALPGIFMKYGHKDVSALNEVWNEFTDGLCKSVIITQHQYDTWTTPKITKDDWLNVAHRIARLYANTQDYQRCYGEM